MRTTTRIMTVACLLLAATAGCDFNLGNDATRAQVNGGSNVAIIDLDVIAKQLSYDKQMAGAIEQHHASLQRQLGVIKANYEQELVKRKQQVGETPTEEQTQYLSQSQRQAIVGLDQEQKKAASSLKQYSAQLVKRFRDQVKSVAREVATEKGLTIILTKNDSVVFDYDTAVDITDMVVEKMRIERPDPVVQPEPRKEDAATGFPATERPEP
ncbi:MAG: OmpH family outer membrane protein [Pirellulales bacterium]|nr:OmpH family outer membrane protein [Pirellulales bacterium]